MSILPETQHIDIQINLQIRHANPAVQDIAYEDCKVQCGLCKVLIQERQAAVRHHLQLTSPAGSCLEDMKNEANVERPQYVWWSDMAPPG
jgi:hypothetical protein